jgi:hypothetical protein
MVGALVGAYSIIRWMIWLVLVSGLLAWVRLDWPLEASSWSDWQVCSFGLGTLLSPAEEKHVTDGYQKKGDEG